MGALARLFLACAEMFFWPQSTKPPCHEFMINFFCRGLALEFICFLCFVCFESNALSKLNSIFEITFRAPRERYCSLR